MSELVLSRIPSYRDAQKAISSNDMKLEKWKLEESIGILAAGVNLNIFFRLKDIINNERKNIYFTCYNLRNLIVKWGVFSKIKKRFIFFDGCRMSIRVLNDVKNVWEKEGFLFTGDVTQNKITDKIIPGFPAYETYYLYKTMISYEEGILSEKNIRDLLGDEKIERWYKELDTKIKSITFNTGLKLEKDSIEYNEYHLDFIEEKKRLVKIYENHHVVDKLSEKVRNLNPTSIILIKRLTEMFQEQTKLGKEFNHILSGVDGAPWCPTIDECDPFSDDVKCGVYFIGTGLFVDQEDEEEVYQGLA